MTSSVGILYSLISSLFSFFGLQVSVEWFLRDRIRIIHSVHLFSRHRVIMSLSMSSIHHVNKIVQ